MTRINAAALKQQSPELFEAAVSGDDIELVDEGKTLLKLVVVQPHAGEENDDVIVPDDYVPQGRLRDDPAIGMWADREDMKDPVEWVRNLREKEWNRFPRDDDSD